MDTIVSSVARALLQVVAGSMIARGWLTADDANLLIGALVTLIALVWSILAKRRAAQVADAQVQAAQASIPPQVTRALDQTALATEAVRETAATVKGMADTLRNAVEPSGLGERGA
ncbi:hypothetical protein [Roseomonas indoligenes]|uniref:Holin n=1 Tax=Roseomonas indoligenes TaxID=2820811 RepID=A0A940MYN8_9PROT|nr:hypothetical protein [Pararoseomonas indoligenes]MBP0492140.1 hypothetical protein [Pararoseomonas indoligenes]